MLLGLPKEGSLNKDVRRMLGEVLVFAARGGAGALKLCGPAFCMDGMPGTAIIAARPGCFLMPDDCAGAGVSTATAFELEPCSSTNSLPCVCGLKSADCARKLPEDVRDEVGARADSFEVSCVSAALCACSDTRGSGRSLDSCGAGEKPSVEARLVVAEGAAGMKETPLLDPFDEMLVLIFLRGGVGRGGVESTAKGWRSRLSRFSVM